MNKKLTTLAAIGVALSMNNTAVAATATGIMTVAATMAEACSVSSATMTFAPISPFSADDIVADTAGSLQIACTALTTPLIWSNSPRVLTGPGAGTVEIPFSLGQTTATALTDALPIISTGQAIAAPFVANGIAQAVPLHGLIRAADYTGKAPGLYTTSITMNVNY
jgi:hypothetical protein